MEKPTMAACSCSGGQGGITTGKTPGENRPGLFCRRDGNGESGRHAKGYAAFTQAGFVRDQSFLRRIVTLQPDDTCILRFVIGAAENRETVKALGEKYQHFRMDESRFDLSWTTSR